MTKNYPQPHDTLPNEQLIILVIEVNDLKVSKVSSLFLLLFSIGKNIFRLAIRLTYINSRAVSEITAVDCFIVLPATRKPVGLFCHRCFKSPINKRCCWELARVYLWHRFWVLSGFSLTQSFLARYVLFIFLFFWVFLHILTLFMVLCKWPSSCCRHGI